jgi:hypothetical protein
MPTTPLGWCIDFDFGDCYVVPHGSSLLISRDTAPEPNGRPRNPRGRPLRARPRSIETDPGDRYGLTVVKYLEVGRLGQF